VSHALAAVLTASILFSAAAPTQERRAEAPRPNPLLAVFDSDGDGALSKQEIAAAAAKLAALDKDGDGALGAEELRAQGSRSGPPEGGRGRQPGAEGAASDLQKPPVPKNEFEKNLLATYDEMRRGPRHLNVPADHGRLLRVLTESIGARCAVEIGTSTGESTVWLALGLAAGGGRLYTHEIDPGRVAIARANFVKAGVADFVTVIEGDAHETVKRHQEPIDILFLDADKEGYIDYFEKLLPLVRPGGLVVAHNMNPRQADPRYVAAITTNPELETIILYAEQGGVSVTMKKR